MTTKITKAMLAAALADDHRRHGQDRNTAGATRDESIKQSMRDTKAQLHATVAIRAASRHGWSGPAAMIPTGTRFEVRAANTNRPVAAFTDHTRAHGCARTIRGARVTAVDTTGRPVHIAA